MTRDKLLIFVTGGTFDKEYNLITGELYFRNTHLHEMLRTGRCNLDVTIRTLMMVDSTDMTEEDRDLIIHNCRRSEAQKIVITHGTDRMVTTAHAIAKAGIPDKTIVLTGAMIPYNFGTSSDGFFNLGAALAFTQTLAPGVYVAMNGRYYNWDRVVKNTQTGYFEEIGEHSEK
ncbi:MAG: asparaginase domain-containing protein [Bacteroidota bacterium]